MPLGSCVRQRTESRSCFVVEAAGGEPQLLTAAPLGVSSFTWSPDSRSIVFSARTPDEGRYGSVDGVSAGSEDARLITDFQYRMNGVGYTADKPLQLFIVEVPQLDAEPKVAPAGRALKALAAPRPIPRRMLPGCCRPPNN